MVKFFLDTFRSTPGAAPAVCLNRRDALSGDFLHYPQLEQPPPEESPEAGDTPGAGFDFPNIWQPVVASAPMMTNVANQQNDFLNMGDLDSFRVVRK